MHLARGEHDGGHLRAVAPLGKERQQERLHEDRREQRARESVGPAALDAREQCGPCGRWRTRALDIVRRVTTGELHVGTEFEMHVIKIL